MKWFNLIIKLFWLLEVDPLEIIIIGGWSSWNDHYWRSIPSKRSSNPFPFIFFSMKHSLTKQNKIAYNRSFSKTLHWREFHASKCFFLLMNYLHQFSFWLLKTGSSWCRHRSSSPSNQRLQWRWSHKCVSWCIFEWHAAENCRKNKRWDQEYGKRGDLKGPCGYVRLWRSTDQSPEECF